VFLIANLLLKDVNHSICKAYLDFSSWLWATHGTVILSEKSHNGTHANTTNGY